MLVKSVSSFFLFSKVPLYWGSLHFGTMEAKFYPFQRKIPWKSLNLPKSRPTSTFISLSLSLGKPLANYSFVQFLNISLLNVHLIKCLLCLFVSIIASVGGNLFLEENFMGREHASFDLQGGWHIIMFPDWLIGSGFIHLKGFSKNLFLSTTQRKIPLFNTEIPYYEPKYLLMLW